MASDVRFCAYGRHQGWFTLTTAIGSVADWLLYTAQHPIADSPRPAQFLTITPLNPTILLSSKSLEQARRNVPFVRQSPPKSGA